MAKLICDIVTPAAKLYSDEAYMVVVPGVEGEMGFLHGHVPLVSALAAGVVRIQSDREADKQRFALQGGYVEGTGGHCRVQGADCGRRGVRDPTARSASITSVEGPGIVPGPFYVQDTDDASLRCAVRR